MIKKVITAIFILLMTAYSLFPEKWVGQYATYRLKPGSLTASGELFDETSMTAACNGFKLGAEVVVINIKTGQEVKVIVNNRIKGESRYFILLTPQAAKHLGMEWETGLAVINAHFSDVNSTDYLQVNGLVSEGSVDEETVKNFPLIQWPEDDQFKKDDFEEVAIQPEYEKRIDPHQKYEANLKDIDKEFDQIKEKELSPVAVAPLSPEKIMEENIIDQDTPLDQEMPLEEIKKEPDTQIARIPEKQDQLTDLDDQQIPGREIVKSPQKEAYLMDIDEELREKEPLIVDDSVKKAEDMKDLIHENQDGFPIIEPMLYPERSTEKMDPDIIEEVLPHEEVARVPQRQSEYLDQDQTIEPIPPLLVQKQPEKSDYLFDPDEEKGMAPPLDTAKQPEKPDYLFDPDEEKGMAPPLDTAQQPEKPDYLFDPDEERIKDPVLEIVEYPEKESALFDPDETIAPLPESAVSLIPEKAEKESQPESQAEIAKIPEKEHQHVIIEKDKETVPAGEWLPALARGQLYIRFATTLKKENADYKLKMYQEIIPGVIGLKKGNKYIFLIGPLTQDELEKTLKGIRSFGFKDAYIIKGR